MDQHLSIAHSLTYKFGEIPKLGDLVFNPAKDGYGVCISLYPDERGWAKIKWAYKLRPIVRPIYNLILIKRGSRA